MQLACSTSGLDICVVGLAYHLALNDLAREFKVVHHASKFNVDAAAVVTCLEQLKFNKFVTYIDLNRIVSEPARIF